jgi:hypothetical protein
MQRIKLVLAVAVVVVAMLAAVPGLASAREIVVLDDDGDVDEVVEVADWYLLPYHYYPLYRLCEGPVCGID